MHRCLADIATPFYDRDKPFRNWASTPFYQLDLPRAPYVDNRQLRRGIERALPHLAALREQGYTGIVVDNLPHMVTLDGAPEPIYHPESPYRARALIYRAAFARLFAEAARLGMECFVTCDMQWATPPVRRYAGRMAADNPRLASVNRAALDELFRAMPEVSGVVVRVGETGGAHDTGDYTGHMIYTDVDELRRLIDTLLPVCERHGKLLVVRTWSIGIGELGDLMWSPERYRAAFGGYTSPHLLVMVKHGPSDFFRHLPHNPTLGLPGPRQIVELQNRREYELFGMVPSGVADLHQAALRHARANPQYAGVWAWNGSGGWGGGRAALGDGAWSLWTELSSALTAALGQDPELDTAAFVRGWCGTRFAQDEGQTTKGAGSLVAPRHSGGLCLDSATTAGSPAGADLRSSFVLRSSSGSFADAVADLYLDSEQIIERGWYLGPLSGGRRSLGGAYLPSLLWVWWMRPTASLIFWAYLASALDGVDPVLRAGEAAHALAAEHAARLTALAPAGDARAAAAVAAAVYLRDVIGVAQTIRALMLPLLAAAWAGDETAWAAACARAREAQAALEAHRAAWRGSADYPPLELAEILAFLRHLDHAPGAIFRQAQLACLTVRRLKRGGRVGRGVYAAGFGAATLLLALLARKSRRSAGVAGAIASGLLAPPVRRGALRATLPWLSRRLFLLPTIFFETGPSISEWTA